MAKRCVNDCFVPRVDFVLDEASNPMGAAGFSGLV